MFKKISIIVTVLLILVLGSYYNAVKINTKQIKIREESIISDKIDEDLDGMLIAYFSDLNYGEFVDSQFLNKTIENINSFKPDLIIFGGNLIRLNTNQDELILSLSSLKPRYGKYAVLGENDGQLVHDILISSGFEILENDNRNIMADKNSYINLVGIDHLIDNKADPAKAFLALNSNHYTLVVSHCPDLFDEIGSYEFDYMLAGHSLGGQIYLPIINLFNRPEGCKKFYRGKISKGLKTLDITNGLGRIKHNARLFSDAEIVLYTLRSGK